MKLYRAIKSNYFVQGFGENLLPIYKELGMLGHTGIDLGCWSGEPIYHSGDWDGIVMTEVDNAGGYGVNVISKEPMEDGRYYKLRYWHLKEFKVYDGQEVKCGDLLGLGDSTGLSTGDHLHFGLKPCDKDGNSLEPNNGYFGAIDPLPYYENVFVGEVLQTKQLALSVIELAKAVILKVQMYLKNVK